MTQKQDCQAETIPIELVVNSDDLLPPVDKLKKYANSDIVFNRQTVARNILETLRVVCDCEEDVDEIASILCRLAEDYEPIVRAELVQQVPHIADFCVTNSCHLKDFIEQYLVPLVITYLTDVNNQVRKTSQNSLLMLVERGLIGKYILEEKVCPLILQLTEASHMDDCRTEAVSLMSKLAPLVGKCGTDRLFLQRFIALCLDSSFHIRMVCAENFGEICTTMERETTEEKLLPKFYLLCEDNVWGVRKVCAEVFTPVSNICSMGVRHRELSPVYICLLSDQSRWVRMAAFQALGQFISTFAEPCKTGLQCNNQGLLDIVDIQNKSHETSDSSHSIPQLSESHILGDLEKEFNSLASCDKAVPFSNMPNSSSDPESIIDHLDQHTVIELNSAQPYVVSVAIDETDKDCAADVKSQSTADNSNCALMDDTQSLSEDFNDAKNIPYSSHCSPEIIESYKIPNSTSSDVLSANKKFKYIQMKNEVCLSEEIIVNGECSSSVVVQLDNESEASVFCYPFMRKNVAIAHRVPMHCNVASEVPCNGFVPSDDTASDIHHESLKSAAASVLLTAKSQQTDLLPVPQQDDNFASKTQFSLTSNGDLTKANQEIEEAPNSVADESAFNHFQYWRMPLPDVEIGAIVDEDDSEVETNCDNNEDRNKHFPLSKHYASSMYSSQNHVDWSESFDACSDHESSNSFSMGMEYKSSGLSALLQKPQHVGSDPNAIDSFHENSDDCKDVPFIDRNKDNKISYVLENSSTHNQDIVPPELLLHYLSMTDASRAQSVDAEIARHCAYSLPAVALTLGRKFWPCLKETYNTLASDMQGFIMQWKVRRTLASSMHQLAVILGPELAAQDLLPIFSGFIKDLDEVRIGILQHLADFLQVLRPKERQEYLPRLCDFLNTDNERNWRFRQCLAEQLIAITSLYDPCDVREYLVPLAISLVQDKVSEVRMISVRVVAVTVKRMSQESVLLTKEVLTELANLFVNSQKWLHRQIYVYLCQELIKECAVSPDQFAEDVMPQLLYLCWDRVPNVRLAVARCLTLVIWPLETFSDNSSVHRELLLQAIHALQSDVDADVKYYASMVDTDECCCLQHSSMLGVVDPAV